MVGIGSQVNEFSSTMDRIRNKQKLLAENAVKLNVMKGIKEIQAALTTISFLDVLASIDVNNPVIKKVQEFETMLSDLRNNIEKFVAENHFDSAEDASLNPEVATPIPGVQMTPEEEEEEKKKEEEKEKSKISLSGIKEDPKSKDGKEDDEDLDSDEKKEKENNKKKLDQAKK